MEIPTNLKYTKNHLWVRRFRKNAYVGITDYFQQQLGLIDLINLLSGNAYNKGEICGEVYTTFHKENIIMPLTGLISCINTGQLLVPQQYNLNPYSNWMMIIPNPNLDELNELLSPADYEKYIYCVSVK